jgi:uncharacterized membrane protein
MAMAIVLHSLSTRHLRGAILLAAAVGLAAANVLRGRFGHELLVAVAWDAAAMTFLALILAVTSRYDESQMAKKVPHRAPSSLLVGSTALCSALFAIYAIALLLSAGGGDGYRRTLHLAVGLLTTVLSWALIHLLFALDYAKLYYAGASANDRSPAGGLVFPGGHPPDYGDFLYFSFSIGVACQTPDVAITARKLRRMALLQSLLAFLFNTVILAATINVAAGLR